MTKDIEDLLEYIVGQVVSDLAKGYKCWTQSYRHVMARTINPSE